MVNEPKDIGLDSFKILNKDILKTLNKGKFLTIPFMFLIYILFSILCGFLFYKIKNSIDNVLIYNILSIGCFIFFSLLFNAITFSFQETLGYLYTQKRFKNEDNTDTFFHSFKEYKTMWSSMKKTWLFGMALSSGILIIISILTISFKSSDSHIVLKDENYFYSYFILTCSILNILYYIQHFYTQFIDFKGGHLYLIYLNQRRFGLSYHEASLLTEKGYDKNQKLFKNLKSIMNIFVILLIIFPVFVLFTYFYYLLIYHCAWQRIYNDQDGVAIKEKVKVIVLEENGVIN